MAAALASRFSRGGRSLLGGLTNAFAGLMNSSNGGVMNGSILSQQQQQQRTFIQMRTVLKAVDNSGAKEVMCIQALKGGKKGARLGDTIVASVKDDIPVKKGKVVGASGKDVNTRAKVKKGMVVYGVVVRSAMPKNCVDGSQVKFDDNAVVIVGIKEKKGKKGKKGKTNSDGTRKKVEYDKPIGTRVFGMEYDKPIGTRVFGPVPHEMRLRKHLKILSLAQHIV